uniref:Uncharacterized protein n=1 Tax=Podoviridae sp. ctsNK10 TaxID=2826582 RepID=A0A8S5NKJ7_9CAUD|nr:MAG TPA: hypothetical protein [Podoviridae sp. ctsNK10]
MIRLTFYCALNIFLRYLSLAFLLPNKPPNNPVIAPTAPPISVPTPGIADPIAAPAAAPDPTIPNVAFLFDLDISSIAFCLLISFYAW